MDHLNGPDHLTSGLMQIRRDQLTEPFNAMLGPAIASAQIITAHVRLTCRAPDIDCGLDDQLEFAPLDFVCERVAAIGARESALGT